MTPKVLDLAGGVYVETVAIVDASGNAVNSSNPLKISIGDSLTSAHIVSAASTTPTSVKASAAKLFNVYAINVAAADRYVKIYNKASAPVVGTDVPVKTVKVPANGVANISIALGTELSAGLAIAITTGVADTDAGASTVAAEVFVDIDYI